MPSSKTVLLKTVSTGSLGENSFDSIVYKSGYFYHEPEKKSWFACLRKKKINTFTSFDGSTVHF